jgi:YcxB-like protein
MKPINMEPLSTTFTTTPSDGLRTYRAIARRAYLTRCVGSVVAIAFGILTRDPLPVVLGVAWYVIAEGWVRRQLAKQLKVPRTVTVTITEDEYRVQGPDAAASRRWAAFQSVRRVQDFWVLRISDAQGMALPVDALDAEQTAVFEDILARNGLLHR